MTLLLLIEYASMPSSMQFERHFNKTMSSTKLYNDLRTQAIQTLKCTGNTCLDKFHELQG